MTPPPYRIETDRLVVRCWEPRDAPLLKDAIDASLDHLQPWMPWALAEPQTLDEKVELLRGFRGQFDLGENFVYGIFSRDESEVAGGTGLHPRVGDGGLEIGYWIRASATGQGYATETTAVLTRVALKVLDVDRVHVHVDPENVASLAIPRKLGFVEEATLRRRLPGKRPGDPRRDQVTFTMLREELEASPCASARIAAAFDAAGRPIPIT
jgi:RimJ/RimL family protein N-acetyltransferase